MSTFSKSLLACAGLVALALPTPAHASSGSPCMRKVSDPAQCALVKDVGHRAAEGPASGTNENTLWALARDRRAHAQCETDTWQLKSGQMVMHHDPTIRRVVDPATMPAGVSPSSRVTDLTLTQWRVLRTKGGKRLPTLHSWIRHSGTWHVRCMIELKTMPSHPATIMQWIQRYGAHDSFYATPAVGGPGCNADAVQAMRQVGATIGLKYPKTCLSRVTLDQIVADGYSYVTYRTSMLTESLVMADHAVGLRVGSSRTPHPRGWSRCVSNHVDFIISPDPEALRTWLG